MAFRRIEIESLRGIERGVVDGLTDVHVLVARNQSGKTTVVEALVRAAQTVGANDPAGRGRASALEMMRPGSRPEERYFADSTRGATTLHFASGARAMIESRGVNVPDRIVWQVSSAVPALRGTSTFRPHHAFDASPEGSAWATILARRDDKILTQGLREVFGGTLESLQMVDQRVMLVHPDRAVSIGSQGDGLRAAFRCFLVLLLLDDTTYAIEEPECHQHPGSLRRFASALVRIAHARRVQLLVTTHSLECLEAFALAARDQQRSFGVHHLSLDGGVLDARLIEPDALDSFAKVGVDPRVLDLHD